MRHCRARLPLLGYAHANPRILRARLPNYLTAAGAALALSLAGCSSGESPPKPEAAATAPAPAAEVAPTTEERQTAAKPWLGDLDGMTERRVVRILVVYNKTNYFLDGPQQRGATYDLGVEFEKWLNRTNKDKTRAIRVVFIPTARDHLLTDLQQGRGDIAAAGLAITPERQQVVSFSGPFMDDVSEILVTSAEGPAPATVEDLSGRSVYVRSPAATTRASKPQCETQGARQATGQHRCRRREPRRRRHPRDDERRDHRQHRGLRLPRDFLAADIHQHPAPPRADPARATAKSPGRSARIPRSSRPRSTSSSRRTKPAR